MAERRPAHLPPLRAPVGPGRTSAGGLALFDLDRTLLAGSSLVALAAAMVEAGLCRRRTLAAGMARDARYRRHGAADLAVGGVLALALRQVAGVERDELLPLVDHVARELASGVAPAARWLVERHLAAGDFVVVLSASPQELVEAVGRRLGAHRSVGTRAAAIDGRFTGELDGPFCYGPGKLERLRAEVGDVDLDDAGASADSASDVPLLEVCARPVAVNPDRRLRAVARERGWPILSLA